MISRKKWGVKIFAAKMSVWLSHSLLSGDFWAAQPTAKVGGDPTPWFKGLGGALGIYQLGLKVSLVFFGRLGSHSQPNVYLDRN